MHAGPFSAMLAGAWAGGSGGGGGGGGAAAGAAGGSCLCAGTDHADCERNRQTKPAWQPSHVSKRTASERRLGIYPGDHILYHGAFNQYLAGAALFSHDAIAIGNDEVVEYGGGTGGGTVRQCTLQNFEHRAKLRAEENWKGVGLAKHGPHKDAVGTVQVREYYEVDGEPTARGPVETVDRVRSRLSEQKYNPFTNNCQNLCYWSKALRPEKTDVTKALQGLGYLRKTLLVWSYMPKAAGGMWLRSAKVATPLYVFAELVDVVEQFSKLPPEKQTKAQLAKITIPKVLMYIAILAGTKLVVWWATKTLASGAVPGASTAIPNRILDLFVKPGPFTQTHYGQTCEPIGSIGCAGCCKMLLANFIATPSLTGAGAVVAGAAKAIGGFVAANALPLALGAAAVLCLGGAAAWAWKRRKKRKKKRVRPGQ
jgi:hypothetical protein